MKTTLIALQLYSLREELDRDFEGTLSRVVEMGYTAVETGNFAGDPDRQSGLFAELGLEVVAAHVPPPIAENKEKSLDFLERVGSKRLVVPWLDPDIYFQTTDGVLKAADLLNEAAANTRERGLVFHYHNHEFEFGQVDGRLAFDILEEHLDPSILFEIDTYWVETAGVDAAVLLQRLGDRAPLLHIKDGLLKRDLPMVAVGDGQMDFTKIIPAAAAHNPWLIVELDSCAGDMMHSVARSLRYLSAY